MASKERREAADRLLTRALSEIESRGYVGAEFLTERQRDYLLPDGTRTLYVQFLTALVAEAQTAGLTDSEILEEVLTVKEYDFLVGEKETLSDALVDWTAEKKAAVTALANADRRGKPRGKYRKVYANTTQMAYGIIRDALTAYGCQIVSEKGNFRDMEFRLPDDETTRYLIVGARRKPK